MLFDALSKLLLGQYEYSTSDIHRDRTPIRGRSSNDMTLHTDWTINDQTTESRLCCCQMFCIASCDAFMMHFCNTASYAMRPRDKFGRPLTRLGNQSTRHVSGQNKSHPDALTRDELTFGKKAPKKIQQSMELELCLTPRKSGVATFAAIALS